MFVSEPTLSVFVPPHFQIVSINGNRLVWDRCLSLYGLGVNDTIQSNSDNLSCYQIVTAQLKKPPGGRNPLADEKQPNVQTEDCLFLDLYVPITAFAPGAPKLPVTVWIYGGGYAFGSKNSFGPLYTGQSMIAASNYQTIFIAGNYRVGAFGWLAGNYMESVAQPNAGLYDQ
jgi:carboxylesterase type B